jgi:hypothetical protein
MSIRFVGPQGRTYSWKTVPAFAKRRNAAEEKTAILRYLFGLARRMKLKEHPLLGHGFRREWIDRKGRLSCVEGTITECFEANKEQEFTVCLNKCFAGLIFDASGGRCSNPIYLRKIDAVHAWGGAMSFSEYYAVQSPARTYEDHCLIWTAPYNVRDSLCSNHLPSRVLFWSGWKLSFRVKPSEIDHEQANLGCFVICESASSSTAHRKYMKLPPGFFIDIGVYGRPEDSIDYQQFLCKNFIYEHQADMYIFEISGDDETNLLVDVSDNLTGKLKEQARKNILPFVNETDGKETSCIRAEPDPAGQVCAQ